MYPTIFHIYGPIAINSYGFSILIGIISALWLASKDARARQLISFDQALTLLSGSVIAGILGARLLYIMLEHPAPMLHDLFAIWQGGGAELGSIIAIALFSGYYMKNHGLKPLPLLDLASIYAPLVQACARIGCFCAGCCHGFITTSRCSIIYTHPNSLAPLHVPLAPAQLYASALFFALFIYMYFYAYTFRKPGQQFFLYLIGASLIRFVIDFWRGDLVYLHTNHWLLSILTTYQWIALGIFIFASVGLILSSYACCQRCAHNHE